VGRVQQIMPEEEMETSGLCAWKERRKGECRYIKHLLAPQISKTL